MRVSASTECGKRDDVEGAFVCGLQHYGRGDTRLEGFLPAQCAEAPLVARLEAGELELGARRDEVVATASGELEELGGHAGTDHVQAAVLPVGVAAAVAEEAGERVERAGLEVGAEDVAGGGLGCG